MSTAYGKKKSIFVDMPSNRINMSGLWQQGLLNVNNICVEYVRFEFSTAMKIPVMVFWVGTPCRYMVGYQHFRGPQCYCLHFTPNMAAAWASNT